ncbi:MAG TPA: MFS transporter [Candidatus Binatia bacterium]
MEKPGDEQASLTDPQNATLLVSLALGHAVVHWFTQSFPIILAELVTSTGIGPLAAGTIMGARSLSGAIANIPVGIAADRYVHRRPQFMAAGLAWLGGSYFLIGSAPNLTWIIVFAAVLGIGGALWHPPAVGLLSTRFPTRRASAMAIHGVGASVGDITGPLLTGALLLALSWQGVLRASLLPAAGLAVMFFWVVRGAGVGDARGHTSLAGYFEALRQAARHRPLLLSITAGGTRTAGQAILVTFVPIYARDDLGLGPGFVGILLALLMGLSLVSQPILGYISDRTSRKATLLPGAAVLVLMTPFLALVGGPWQLLSVVCIIGPFLFSSALLLNALGLDLAPAGLHSSVTAAQFLTGLGLGSAAPVIAGATAAAAGTAAAFYVAVALFGVTLAIVLVLPSTKSTTPTPRFAVR